MSAGKTKLILFAGALVLTVLLFIAPRTMASGKTEQAETKGRSSDISAMELYEEMALKKLDPEAKITYDRLAAVKKYDSIQYFWAKVKRPDLTALAAEKHALDTKKADDFFEAGDRYYNSIQFTRDKSVVPVLVQSAIRCYREGLKTEPGNTDARIMLASCLVEGGSEPMEGIRLLQEVEKTDSSNIKVQLSFAFFSVKSGQYDKAVARFSKVLAIDSSYIEAYLHLADIYEQQGKSDSTIMMLERYASRTDNITARLEVKKYIEQLKTKN